MWVIGKRIIQVIIFTMLVSCVLHHQQQQQKYRDKSNLLARKGWKNRNENIPFTFLLPSLLRLCHFLSPLYFLSVKIDPRFAPEYLRLTLLLQIFLFFPLFLYLLTQEFGKLGKLRKRSLIGWEMDNEFYLSLCKMI